MASKSKRQFSSSRLYNLSKWAVIISTVILLVIALQQTIQGNRELNYKSIQKECDYLTGGEQYPCESDLIDYYTEKYAHTGTLYILIILLPILFFGGNKAYNYIFPKK